MRIKHYTKESIEKEIKECQKCNHVQQVAFSTYHNAITQICFTCDNVRTSLSEDDLKGSDKEGKK